jgi:CheY-like chemotaxis protein
MGDHVRSILLIEDEAALQRLISWFLLDEGYEVSVTDGAETALKRLEHFAPDVIVYNTIMEEEPKREAMAKMRQLAPSSRILDVSQEKNARASGVIGISLDGKYADASLELPFPKERLLEAIEKLLSGEGAAPA